MTTQLYEKLLYKGQDVGMDQTPLYYYAALGGAFPTFVPQGTTLWRGYIGSWQIIDDRLYLVGISGTRQDGQETNLDTIFPEFPDRVFAHWFCDCIKLPQGKRIFSPKIHRSAFVYEADLVLEFEDGVLVKETLQSNDPEEQIP
jgi:hypothetical protein